MIGWDDEPQLSLRYLTLPLLCKVVATYEVNLEGGMRTTMDDRELDRPFGATGDPGFLVNTLQTVFSSSEALNQSFLVGGISIFVLRIVIGGEIDIFVAIRRRIHLWRIRLVWMWTPSESP